jgi:hypothetical protein
VKLTTESTLLALSSRTVAVGTTGTAPRTTHAAEHRERVAAERLVEHWLEVGSTVYGALWHLDPLAVVGMLSGER